MNKFIKSSEYQNLKTKYEKNFFKICGKYAYYDGDKLKQHSANDIAEYFKNKKVVIKIETETDDGEVKITKKEKSFYAVWSEDAKMKEYRSRI